MVQCVSVQLGVVQCGIGAPVPSGENCVRDAVWCSLEECCFVWYRMVHCGFVWYRMVQCGVFFGTGWCSVVMYAT